MPLPSVAGLVQRLESDSITAVDGDTPATWADQSGNGFDATRVTAFTYRTGVFLGGLPGLEFAGSGSRAGVSSLATVGSPPGLELYGAFTIFDVILVPTRPAYDMLVVTKDTDASGERGYDLGVGSDGKAYAEKAGGVVLSRGAGPGLDDNRPHVLALTFDGTTWTTSLFSVTGETVVSAVVSGACAPNAAAPWQIGGRSIAGFANAYGGFLGAQFIYDSALGDADRLAVGSAYLATKYVGTPPPPPASPLTAQIDPSCELLLLKYVGLNGVTLAKILAVDGTATLTVDGVPFVLTNWLHWGHSILAFALCPSPKSATIVDDTDPGFVKSGAWNIRSKFDAGNNFRPNETAVGLHFVDSSDPLAEATYTYPDSVPGPHTLYHMLWDRPDTDRTTDAVYTVRDGTGNLLATFHLDLLYDGSHPIWPFFDESYGGYNWIRLGDFTLAAGQDTIVVTVSNGAGAGVLVVDGLLVRHLLASPVAPGAVVTLDMDAGVVTTDSDVQPAVVGRAVTFATDADLMAFDAGRPRTLKVGYNKEGFNAVTSTLALMAANRGPFTGGWVATGEGAAITLSDDFKGELASIESGAAQRTIHAGALNFVDGRFIRTLADGEALRIEFDWPAGQGDFDATKQARQRFECSGNTSVTKGAYTDLGDGRWRLAVTIQVEPWRPGSTRGPAFLPWDVTDTAFIVEDVIHNYAQFDSHVPIGYEPFTHPDVVARFAGKGLAVFRLMDLMATNSSVVVNWGDYYPPDASGTLAIAYRYDQPILAIGPVDQSDLDLDGTLPGFPYADFAAVVKLTVPTTVGLVTGHWLDITDPGSTQQYPGDPIATGLHGATLATLKTPFIEVKDATTLLASIPFSSGGDGVHPNTIDAVHVPPAGTRLHTARPGQHPQLAAVMCRELGVSPWYCMPALCSDQYVRDWADMALAHSDPGTMIYGEYSNEIWNFPAQGSYVGMMARFANALHAADPVANPLHFGTGLAWGAYRSDRCRQLAQARFDLAGRSADLFWNLGTETANSGVTAAMVTWGATQTPPVTLHFDGLCGETYTNFGTPTDNQPLVTSDVNVDTFYDRLSLDGQISLGACTVLDGGRDTFTRVHRDLLDANGFASTVNTSYEGGWDFLARPGCGTVDVGTRWSQELSRSWRMFRLTKAYLQMLDIDGFAVWCRYTPDLVAGAEGAEVWCDFAAVDMGIGTGDPAENPHPWDMAGAWGPAVVSEMGGGVFAWASAAPGDLPVAARSSLALAGAALEATPGHGSATAGLALADVARAVGARRAAAASGLVLGGGATSPLRAAPRAEDGGYLGRFATGRRVPLLVRTLAPGSRPAAPDAVPTATLIAPDGTVAASYALPPADPGAVPGLFGLSPRLGAGLARGRYHVVYRYAAGGRDATTVESFDLVAGDPGGAVIALHAHDRPEATYVLAQLDGGALVQGRNPRF